MLLEFVANPRDEPADSVVSPGSPYSALQEKVKLILELVHQLSSDVGVLLLAKIKRCHLFLYHPAHSAYLGFVVLGMADIEPSEDVFFCYRGHSDPLLVPGGIRWYLAAANRKSLIVSRLN